MLRIGSVVIRVDDLPRQTAFWSAALDYVPRDGIGPNVNLDRWHADVQLPPKIHLDLYAKDQAAEVARLVGLGATEVHWDRMPRDADFVILADPEGNRFCVIDASKD